MSQNTEIIKKALIDAYKAPTEQLTKDYFLIALKHIQTYNLQLENFYNKIQVLSRPIIAENASDTTKTYEIFRKLRYLEPEADKILKDGYIILDILREFFTKEKITYRIGIEYRGDLYEKTIDLEELLKYTKVDYNTKSKIDNLYKLRMTNKSNLRQAFQREENTLTAKRGDSSTVYSRIREYVKAQPSTSKDRNKGNAYEVYRLLMLERNNINKIPPELSNEDIAATFDRIRKNIVSSTQGGDILTEQVKFFSSAPSLITTANIRNNLKEIEVVFNQFINSNNSQEFQKSLEEIFTKQIVDSIEQQGVETAQKAIEERISKLNLTK